IIIGSSRLLSAVSIIWIAHIGGTLTQLACAVASVNVASYIVQYMLCCHRVPDINLSHRLVSKAALFELLDYCFSLTIWSLGLLLVTGLDLTIVGIYHFEDV